MAGEAGGLALLAPVQAVSEEASRTVLDALALVECARCIALGAVLLGRAVALGALLVAEHAHLRGGIVDVRVGTSSHAGPIEQKG